MSKNVKHELTPFWQTRQLLALSEGTDYVRSDHKTVHIWNLASCCHWDVLVFDLQRLQELVADFPVFGDFKLNLLLQNAVAGRLHAVLNAELFFFLAQTVPLIV